MHFLTVCHKTKERMFFRMFVADDHHVPEEKEICHPDRPFSPIVNNGFRGSRIPEKRTQMPVVKY